MRCAKPFRRGKGGTAMRSVRASTARLGSFFGSYLSAPGPDHGKPGTDRGMAAWPRGAPDSVRWWWVLVTGTGVGAISYLLLYPVTFGYVLVFSLLNRAAQSSVEEFVRAYSIWGMPTMHMLLMIFAASWLARKVGTAAVTHGVLTAVVSVVVNQAIVLFAFPPLNPGEAAIYLAMALTGGLLGGVEGRSVLAGQDALHQ